MPREPQPLLTARELDDIRERDRYAIRSRELIRAAHEDRRRLLQLVDHLMREIERRESA